MLPLEHTRVCGLFRGARQRFGFRQRGAFEDLGRESVPTIRENSTKPGFLTRSQVMPGVLVRDHILKERGVRKPLHADSCALFPILPLAFILFRI